MTFTETDLDRITTFEDIRTCDVELVDGTDCDFEGDVEVVVDTYSVSSWWTCPKCSTEHDEDWGDDL